MFTCPCMVTAPPPYPILRGWTSVTIGFPRDRPLKKRNIKKNTLKEHSKTHISKEPSKEDTYLESLQNKDLTYRWSEGDPSQDGQGHLRMSPGMLSLVWEMELKSTVGRPLPLFNHPNPLGTLVVQPPRIQVIRGKRDPASAMTFQRPAISILPRWEPHPPTSIRMTSFLPTRRECHLPIRNAPHLSDRGPLGVGLSIRKGPACAKMVLILIGDTLLIVSEGRSWSADANR